MLDFTDLPKQWVVCETDPGPVTSGRLHRWGPWYIAVADALPVIVLRRADGTETGRLIGWVIEGDRFHRTDGEITLVEGQGAEELYPGLGGRFVMMWTDPKGRTLVREDASGNLPAVFHADARILASTTTAMEMLVPLVPDEAANAVFEFPKRRGFLPYGLTSRLGVRRLMPNHALDVEDFGAFRIWPSAPPERVAEDDRVGISALVAEAGAIVRRNVAAILTQGETVIYLSGGHDSRMIIAAAHGLSGDLRAETLRTKEGLDTHIARRLAALEGLPHEEVTVLPCPPQDIEAWVRRCGWSLVDFVTETSTTISARPSEGHAMSGTGSDLPRGYKWLESDFRGGPISPKEVTARIRVPNAPAFAAAGDAYFAGMPSGLDTQAILDLATIEQLHGCWAGAGLYGNPVSRPPMHPFSGGRLAEISMALPSRYRFSGAFYRDFVRTLAPRLAEVPVNRASGLRRLGFWKHELRTALPEEVRRFIKPFR